MIFGPASDGYPIVNYEYAIVPDQAAQRARRPGGQGGLAWAIDPSGGQRPVLSSTRSASWPCPARW